MPLSMEALLSISAAVGFIVIVALIIGVIYRRKAWKAKQECKNMNIQLETLESSVRNTCRRGKIFPMLVFKKFQFHHLYYYK